MVMCEFFLCYCDIHNMSIKVWYLTESLCAFNLADSSTKCNKDELVIGG